MGWRIAIGSGGIEGKTLETRQITYTCALQSTQKSYTAGVQRSFLARHDLDLLLHGLSPEL